MTETGTFVTHPLIAAVRAAESACLTASTSEERLNAELDLGCTAVALNEKVKALYDDKAMTGWLITEGDWLDAAKAWLNKHSDHADWFARDDRFSAREERWLSRLEFYKAGLAALIDAKAMLTKLRKMDEAEQAMLARSRETETASAIEQGELL